MRPFLQENVGATTCELHVPEAAVECVLIVLHGYAMEPEDLAPLALAMGLNAVLCLPRGLHAAPERGRSWWPLDEERRRVQLARGPRDLSSEHPAQRDLARASLLEIVAHLRQRHTGVPVVIAGFSQGGMLACDTIVHEDLQLQGLVLLSSSCIAWDEWQPWMHRFRNLPVLVSHGTSDADLSYAAGEKLRDRLSAAGADVTWVPFEGGHEIPFTVWRQLKQLMRSLSGQQTRR